jgi:hypothetical protein
MTGRRKSRRGASRSIYGVEHRISHVSLPYLHFTRPPGIGLLKPTPAARPSSCCLVVFVEEVGHFRAAAPCRKLSGFYPQSALRIYVRVVVGTYVGR